MPNDLPDYPRNTDGSMDWDKVERVVEERINSDPEFAAQCKRDIDDFFVPSPLFLRLQKISKDDDPA